MKAIMAITFVFFGQFVYAQSSAGNIKQHGGSCNAANSGNNSAVHITCRGIGAQQGRQMTDILNKIIANQSALPADVVLHKLDEIIELAAKGNQARYQQQCTGSACAQGPGSQATYNQLGPPKLLFSDDQREKVKTYMADYAGTRVTVICDAPTQDSMRYAMQLSKALKDAGLLVDGPTSAMLFGEGVKPSGAFIRFGESTKLVAEALSSAMKCAGVIDTRLPTQLDDTPKDKFEIDIFPSK